MKQLKAIETDRYSMDYILPTFISSILIIIGWAVLFGNAKKISSRAETKSLIDLIVNKIDTLTTFSTKYWLNSEADPAVYELQVMNQITQICGLMNLLPSRGIDVTFQDIEELILKCTLNCETIVNMEPSQKRINAHDVNSISIRCIENLYKTFQQKHAPVN
ncbi:MAG: hypothetical protein ACPG52_06275 [Cognaticolwellia sp.]